MPNNFADYVDLTL